MTQLLRVLLAAGLAANGLAMLLFPKAWYDSVPGVDSTGPLNFHFVRDIGCAYLVSAFGLAWRAWRPRQGGPAALAGALFLLLHAGVHIAETLLGICGWQALWRDVPGVIVPALLALALALPLQPAALHNSPATR
ncbi:hypothetical protein OOT46_22430 [Aquabacterium sp. A7-Y]|uniref:hypothetical protein n=1 Tax=Aquabacterium sp. A7-Y TaxID=1349605 RepID=UPI00223DE498|nr:hypothetical protein [Aquabacterium sp. A7-Y]MCW7540585.1 hypothetical protein [Aquabacterium sp. A7-Y]